MNNPVIAHRKVPSSFPKENVVSVMLSQKVFKTDANGSHSFLSNAYQNRYVIVPFPEFNEKTGEKNSVKDFQEMINLCENPCIQQEFSSEIIVSEKHIFRINKGELTLQQLESRQLVVNNKEEPILDSYGQLQYRVRRFLFQYQPDIDNRRLIEVKEVQEVQEEEAA